MDVFDPQDPLRPPDWRIRTAAQLAAEGRYLSPYLYDSLTCTAARYLASCAVTTTNLQRGLLARQAPDLSCALALKEAADSRTWELEARLLTREPTGSIGGRLGMTPAAVRWYAMLFFDVRPRIAQESFILRLVVERNHPAADLRDGLWKVVAYHGGFDALERLLGRNSSGGFDAVALQLAHLRELALLYRTSQAALESGPLPPDVVAMLKLAAAANAQQTGEGVEYAANLEALLKAVNPYMVQINNLPQGEWENGHVELRPLDRLRLKFGIEPDRALLDVRFPGTEK